MDLFNIKPKQQEYKLTLKSTVDYFDFTLVVLKIFMILVTITLMLMYCIKFFYKSDDIQDTIDFINRLLYHMILIIFFFIALITLWTFRRYWRVAADKSLHKMNEIVHDTKKALKIKHYPPIKNKSTLKAFSSYAKSAVNKIDNYVHASDYIKQTTAHIDQFVDNQQTREYVSSLVWWNFLFLLPIYFGLFNSKNCRSEAITMFA